MKVTRIATGADWWLMPIDGARRGVAPPGDHENSAGHPDQRLGRSNPVETRDAGVVGSLRGRVKR
jgi:hypothetical protein